MTLEEAKLELLINWLYEKFSENEVIYPNEIKEKLDFLGYEVNEDTEQD